MRKKQSGEKGSLFRQLVVSYIVFAVVSVILLYLCMFGVLIFIGGGEMESLAPYELVDDAGNVKDLGNFERLGGWVERLNESYQVLEVYGEKKDSVMSYSMEDLTEYLSTDNLVDSETSASEYRGYLKAARKEAGTEYYFMKIARDTLQMSYNYNVGSNILSSRVAATAFALFGVLFLADCLLMSTYLSRRIRKPLRKIMEGMEQVRDGGQRVRLEFEAQREFAKIRDTFNVMIGQLEENEREKRQNEEKRNRILLEISHDIKTPVATIKSSANALEEGVVKSEELSKYYRIIDQKAERVDTLVHELFLFLKIEDAEYRLQKEKTDLCELTRQICADYYDEFVGRGLDFEIQIPEAPIYAMVDRKEFPRVIENLLGNAVKYNRTGQMAAVGIQKMERGTEILIRDDGEAIREELRPILFDPFARGDQARQSDGGTGLGLAIAGKIMEKHGGELQYIRQNKENIFRIFFPVPDQNKRN